MRTMLLLVMICVLSTVASAKYGGGTGDPNTPYLIYTAEQMNAIGAYVGDWSKCFKLMADIDLAQYTGTQFNIIGYAYDWPDIQPFTGVFDGNGHTISNFTRDANDGNYVGLFGYVGDWQQVNTDTEIRNLTLLNPRVRAAVSRSVGATVGILLRGRITNCCVEGGQVQGYSSVGVLVGQIDNGMVSACYATGSASGNNYDVGGLTGHNSGIIRDCYSSAAAAGQWYVGGLVGDNVNVGTVVNCYSTGVVSGVGCVGGLAGGSDGAVVSSYWDTTTSQCADSAGGKGRSTGDMHKAATFGGWTPASGKQLWTINDGNDYPRLYWQNKPGKIMVAAQLRNGIKGMGTKNDPFLIQTAEELNMVGQFSYDWDKQFKMIADIDLAGYSGTAFNIIGAPGSPFTGVFDGDHHTILGFHYTGRYKSFAGVFGYIDGQDAQVKNVNMLNPNVALWGGGGVGTLAGCLANGTISNCTATNAAVSASGNGPAGGLVGYSDRGTVVDSWATATVYTQCGAGGLIGYNGGTIQGSFATASVTAWDSLAGGLTGDNWNWGTVARCFSSGSVSAPRFAGGLVGSNSYYTVMRDCYSTCTVTGTESVGGLLGENSMWSLVTNCYSTGNVSGSKNTGGFIGADDLSTVVAACFWDTRTSNQVTSINGTGKTTEEMKKAATFVGVGWDFAGETANGMDDIWRIDEGKDYPRLSWETK